jgi:sugar-specific transcriptional regulator TrmB
MLNTQLFEQFGLNEKEAKIYLAALGLGMTTIQQIATASGVHRVSTYDLIESLLAKGFIKSANQGNKRSFIAASPEEVQEIIRRKEKQFADILPELKALQGTEDSPPKVSYFESKDEIWLIIGQIFSSPPWQAEICIYGSPPDTISKLGKKSLANNLFKQLKPPAKIIVQAVDFEATERNLRKDPHKLKQLPPGEELFGLTIIAGNRTLTINPEKATAVLTEDKDSARNQLAIFTALWKVLPEKS